ncbi:MAG: hypothetical protein F2785_04715 [Actinobacteria bacterium]|nr:hypothetical protein [Actinomycetota bacterium]
MGLMPRKALVALVTVGFLPGLLLAGCASSSPTGTPSDSQEPTSSPTSTTIAEPVDVTEAFREIAYASCDKANAEGVVESGWDGDPNQKTILVPDSEAYQDFSAVFVGENGVLALIWETDSFASCNASNVYSLAEEAGQEAAIDLTFNEADGTYQTILDQAPDQEAPFVATYTVSNGLIVQQHIDADWGEATIEITYGMPSDDDIAFLRKAVDAFLAENG